MRGGGMVVPNLTPSSGLSQWTEEDFLAVMCTGARPDGSHSSSNTAYKEYGLMMGKELSTLFKNLL